MEFVGVDPGKREDGGVWTTAPPLKKCVGDTDEKCPSKVSACYMHLCTYSAIGSQIRDKYNTLLLGHVFDILGVCVRTPKRNELANCKCVHVPAFTI